MKIILIGFMGAGKTTVARFLSNKLKFSQIEIDDEIVKKSDEKSVSDIFKKHGETKFRELELEVCRDLEFVSNIVISTGGGVGIDERKMDLLTQDTGIVFFLKTELSTVKKRIGNDKNRPLFADIKKVEALFEKRKKQYAKFSDFEISTDEKLPEEVANEIVEKLENLKLCLVIGDPIRHSLSPAFHNTGFKSMGISDFVFKTQRIETENLSKFFQNIPQNVRGISVTIPHKIEVLKFCDETSVAVKKIGAANTIFFKNGKIYAENTDARGAIDPILKRVSDLKNKRFSVLGAGGAARAIVYEAKELGANVAIFTRNIESAKKLAVEFKADFGTLSETEKISKSDIIVNATPCGMTGKFEEISAVPFSVFQPNQVVFDSVYTLVETKFLREAREAGAQTISGIEMFTGQAMKQFEIYTGQKLLSNFCENFIKKFIKDE